jgi:hypothetical protein
MPPEIVNKINAAVVKSLKLKETEEQLQNDGVAPAGGTPQQFGETIKREIVEWRKVVTSATSRPTECLSSFRSRGCFERRGFTTEDTEGAQRGHRGKAKASIAS